MNISLLVSFLLSTYSTYLLFLSPYYLQVHYLDQVQLLIISIGCPIMNVGCPIMKLGVLL